MEKLTIKQQKEVLNNTLKSLRFDDKYFIKDIFINNITIYAIATKYIVVNVTDYMTYDQMQKWFLGYRDGLEKKFSRDECNSFSNELQVNNMLQDISVVILRNFCEKNGIMEKNNNK